MWLFIKEFVNRFRDEDISVFASCASFFIMISSIPFIMLLLGLSKYFIPLSADEILHGLSVFLPVDIYKFTETIVFEIFSKAPGSLLSITAITTLWSASRGILAIIQGLNNVYNAPKYGFIQGRIIAFFYTFIFILALIVTLILLILSNSLLGIFSANIYIPILWILLSLIFSLMYKFLPQKKSTFKSQLPGAMLVSILWIGFTLLYSLYINNFSNFSYVYGSLAAIVLLMLWLYICMTLFLCGAEFNEILRNKKLIKK